MLQAGNWIQRGKNTTANGQRKKAGAVEAPA